MTEATLARAQAGDGEAFRELVDPYRGELFAHCYRILGSFHDAEDVLQEALLGAWRAIGQFDGRALRAWLYRIATNRCLNYLRGESRRPQPAGLPDRPWYRHVVYAPGLYTGYGVKTIPGVREAVDAGNYTRAAEQASIVIRALQRATRTLWP